MRGTRKISSLFLTALYVLFLSLGAMPARARCGCGCDKAPGIECRCNKRAEKPVEKCCKSQSEARSNKCGKCTCGLEKNPEPPARNDHTVPPRTAPIAAESHSFFIQPINTAPSPEAFSRKVLFDNSDVPLPGFSFIHAIHALRAPPALS